MARVGKNKQPKKHSGRPQKEAIVDELSQKLETSRGVVFADYQGLTNKQIEDLKKELKDSNSSFTVTKNSLLKLSLKKTHYADVAKDIELKHPTATLLMNEDTTTPLKAIAKSFKALTLPKVKFGIIDGLALDEEGVLKLASLPPRDVLIAQFVGTLNSPIQSFVVGLNGVLQKFVMTLDAIAKAKPSEPAPTPTPELQPQPEQASTEPAGESANQETQVSATAEPTTQEQPAEEQSKQQPENQETTKGGDSNG